MSGMRAQQAQYENAFDDDPSFLDYSSPMDDLGHHSQQPSRSSTKRSEDEFAATTRTVGGVAIPALDAGHRDTIDRHASTAGHGPNSLSTGRVVSTSEEFGHEDLYRAYSTSSSRGGLGFTDVSNATPLLSAAQLEESGRPTKRWVYQVPEGFEDVFRRFDDEVIRFVQIPLGYPGLSKAYQMMSLFFTTMTSIELGVALPFMLYVLARDTIAELSVYLILATCVLSQIPKRFLWRNRPWMAKRAVPCKKDKTSSFPSRAVTCGLVYGFIIGQSNNLNGFVSWFIGLVFALFASVSRITLGAHYPSDCLFGILAGTSICVIGTLLYHSEIHYCESCAHSSTSGEESCYSTPANAYSYDHTDLNWLVLFLCFFVACIVDALSLVPPLHFWSKGNHVYGMLLSCITFHLVFLCPHYSGGGRSSLGDPRSPVAGAYFIAAVGMIASFASAAKTRKLKTLSQQFTSFFAMYLTILFILSAWRLSRFAQEDPE